MEAVFHVGLVYEIKHLDISSYFLINVNAISNAVSFLLVWPGKKISG